MTSDAEHLWLEFKMILKKNQYKMFLNRISNQVFPNKLSLQARIIVVGLVLVLLVACGAANNPNPTQNTQTEGYPSQTDSDVSQNDSGYPAVDVVLSPEVDESVSAYPGTESEEVELDQPRFQFDALLTAGMTEVSGQAPPGLPLAVVDISFNGIVLGSGVSDETGHFTIGVAPLPDGHRVGLAISDLQGKTLEQMVEELYPYRGDDFMSVPNVGIFFETMMVQP
jgi:hypothetical protein